MEKSKMPLCFIVKSPQDRIDCNFYNPEYIKLEEYIKKSKNSKQLSKICEITDGSHEKRNYFEEGILFLRINNIKEDGINLSNAVYISKDEHKTLNRSRLIKGDILLTKTGTLGVTFVIPEDFGEANISADIGLIRIKDKYKDDIIPEFLSLYLSSKFTIKQIYKNISGSSRDRIVLTNLKKLFIIIPKKDKQKEILDKIDKLKEKVKEEQNLYRTSLHKLNTVLDGYTNLDLSNMLKTWIIPSEKIFDRMDCYFNSKQLEEIYKVIKNLDKDKFEIVKAKSLDIISIMDKEEREKNKTHIFKYVDIGNTEKDLGWIMGFEEDILINLPSRAKVKGLENDILIPRPIGSTQGIIKIPFDFDGELFSTGNIQIRPKDKNEAILLWVMLKSEIMQKQLFYLQSGCSQPEISPNNFKEFVLFPFPKSKIKEEIIKKSLEHSKMALKHRENIINLKNQIIKLFEKEINNICS